mgnify:CR=1 FL=1
MVMVAGKDGMYLDMMNQWMILKYYGIGLPEVLVGRKIETVVIYGMGIYGRHLTRELKNSELRILYGIDGKQMKPFEGVNIVKLQKNMPLPDIVINTVIHEHGEIEKELCKYYRCEIISLEDLIFQTSESL